VAEAGCHRWSHRFADTRAYNRYGRFSNTGDDVLDAEKKSQSGRCVKVNCFLISMGELY